MAAASPAKPSTQEKSSSIGVIVGVIGSSPYHLVLIEEKHNIMEDELFRIHFKIK